MHLTVEAQNLCRIWIPRGGIAIDATAGNGLDTQFLAECVGIDGHVYALDVQQSAIERTAKRIAEIGLASVVKCIQANHADLLQHVPKEVWGKVFCAMFNLGYLPHGDKTIVTRAATTIQALEATDTVLAPKSILSILVYVGQSHGQEEALAVEGWIERHRAIYDVERYSDPANPVSPILWFLRKRGEAESS